MTANLKVTLGQVQNSISFRIFFYPGRPQMTTQEAQFEFLKTKVLFYILNTRI